jgi:hypothetical protein
MTKDESRTFLGVAERRPHLRAIDLPSKIARTVSGRADQADAAFSEVWIRQGWLALRSHQQLWALPLPISGEARLLATTYDAVPHQDGRRTWIQHPAGDRWTAVDLDGGASVSSIPRQADERLEATYHDTVLVRDGAGLALRLRHRQGADLVCGEGTVVCQAGPLAVVRSELGAALDVLDVRDGRRRRIERRGFGCWGQFASTSPNGSLVAIGWELRAAPIPRPLDIPFGAWLRHPDNQRSEDHRNVMTIIDLANLALSVIAEPLDNFATRPAWASAGGGFAFCIPFEARIAWVDLATGRLTRIGTTATDFVPMIDATDLVGAGINQSYCQRINDSGH